MKKYLTSIFICIALIVCGVSIAYGSGAFAKTNETETPEIVNITISKQPTKTTYYIDETFEVGGMRIRVLYNDKEQTEKTFIVDKAWVSGEALDENYKFREYGDIELTVTYGGKSDTFTVHIWGGLIQLQ